MRLVKLTSCGKGRVWQDVKDDSAQELVVSAAGLEERQVK
jgi:hypothetical protein